MLRHILVICLAACAGISCGPSAAVPNGGVAGSAGGVQRIPAGFYRGPLGRAVSPREFISAILRVARPAAEPAGHAAAIYGFSLEGRHYKVVIGDDQRWLYVCKDAGQAHCPPPLELLSVQEGQYPGYTYLMSLIEEEANPCAFQLYSGIEETIAEPPRGPLLQYEWNCFEHGYVWAEIVTPEGVVYKRTGGQGEIERDVLEDSWARHPEKILATRRYDTPLYRYLRAHLAE